MFFMGGMTMGYLHPAQPAKGGDGTRLLQPEQKDGAQLSPSETSDLRDRAFERTLIWAWRVLC
jgi:hypothetical protein